MAIWLILTLNFYWIYWLHQTYKEIGAHSPGVTRITPDSAVGFLFIPVFNLYWIFRLLADFPGAIRKLQQTDPPGEPVLLRSGWLTALGCIAVPLMIAGAFLGVTFWILGETLLACVLATCQYALNAHWKRRKGSGEILIAPTTALADRSFAALIGVAAHPVEWARVAVFLAAASVAGVAWVVAVSWPPRLGSPLPAWVFLAGREVVGSVLMLGAFWLVRNVIGAATVTAAALTPITLAIWLVTGLYEKGNWRTEYLVVHAAFAFLAAFVYAGGLAVAATCVRPLWLAFWAAYLAAGRVSELADWSYIFVRFRGDWSYIRPIPHSVADFAASALFALVFCLGLHLLHEKQRPTVLAPSPAGLAPPPSI